MYLRCSTHGDRNVSLLQNHKRRPRGGDGGEYAAGVHDDRQPEEHGVRHGHGGVQPELSARQNKPQSKETFLSFVEPTRG